MDGSSKSDVHERRAEGERETNGMEVGRVVEPERDREKDEAARNNGHRGFEGKVMRKKRGFRDMASSDKKYLSKFKRISERGDDSPPDRDVDRRPGHSSRKELSWKEIAERKQARSRLLNGKSDTEGDNPSNPKAPEEKERKERGKIQPSNHFKGLKGGDTKFSQKRKAVSGSQFEGEHKRKKSEPIKKRRHRLILQDHSDDDDYYVPIKKDPLPESRALEAKDGDNDPDFDAPPTSTLAGGSSGPPADQGVRKSSRVPKKKVLEDFEDDPDVGLPPKSAKGKQSEANGKSESQESDFNEENEAGNSDRPSSESDPDAEDWNEDLGSVKTKGTKGREGSSKSSDPFSYGTKGRSAPLTARQRSIQLEKDGNESVGMNLIEFPDGLAHFSRRVTTKLTVEDRLAKKAEAASRRKQVVEKAAKDQQATAIQKILGQDSSRRKKEERLQKQREEIELGKKAAALEAPANSVRWTLGPNGTTVSWSQDAELPEIFCPSAGPPPPQLCAAPSCSKPRKYRDSKSNVPLCSLQCYRVVNPTAQLVS